MVNELADIAEQDFKDKIRDETSMLRDYFVRRTQKFDDYMKRLIAVSQQDLNGMFLTTYGEMYRENDALFMDLFTSLRNYYFGIEIDLEQVMDDFFFVLFQKMFALLNVDYEYTSSFWMCTGNYMEELMPFENIPQKLTLQIRRSLTAARTFVQGLGIGRDVVTDISKVDPSQSCKDALTRLSQCASCNGHTWVPPCYSFCQNVMKGCLSSEVELQQEWYKYVDAMSKLSDRLEGPFNVQAVLSSIDLEISNGIMSMQEMAPVISPKVMEGCGPLPSKRSKRSDRSRSRTPVKKTSNQRTYAAVTAESLSVDFRRLLKDVKKKLKEWERIWSGLSYQVCNDPNVAAPTVEEENCWNGETVGSYTHEQVGQGISDQQTNPEVIVDLTKPNFMVRKQITKLRTITQQLKNAVEGKDADWIDTEYASGSGSGSGSGYGDSLDDVQVEDPKYRPTVEPPEGTGAHTLASWSCLFVFLLVSLILRW
ncbi:hypothetical protein BSL78_22264 [Apostichopus japonicus]|uniref:Glypican-6 n=1 Tax=Stichopus japonicus TaxID=307972 RepID=A0A2G8JYM9_STIJA|nr:hypothetical protein BSL78_22264 [Apostichopus japonicus]